MPLYAGELNLRSNAPLAEYPAPLGEVLRAQRDQTRLESPTTALSRLNDLGAAERGDLIELGDPMAGTRDIYAPPKMVDAATARTRVADEGLTLNIPQEGIAERALDILIKRKREELQRQNVMSRGPDGIGAGAARLGVSLFESLLDPLNIASAFVPVIGPARYARLVGGASGAMGRAGVRAGVGAAEGAVGAAMLEPLIYAAGQAEQADYTMADSLTNIGFGAIFGGGLHVAAGAARDWIQPGWWRETPPGRSPNEAQVVAMRTEPETRDAALRVSVAQAAEGRVIDVEPIIKSDEAAFTVYHGSPHDFDRFDLSKIGTGEGAQAYGHGLYFAESPGVAKAYQAQLSGDNIAARNYFDANGRILASVGDVWQASHDAAQATGIRGDHARRVASDIQDWIEKGRKAETFLRRHEVAPELLPAYQAAAKAWDGVTYKRNTGSLYRAEIPKSAVDRMLDWDRPLSEQPEAYAGWVRAMEAHAGRTPNVNPAAVSGAQAYDMLTGGARGMHGFEHIAQQASKALNRAGIPGIRYLDGGSRGAGEGTRNIVLFDDSLARIVEKNGQPITPEQARGAAERNQSAIRSAEEPIPEPVKMSDDVKAAQQELDNAMTVVEEMAEALGVDRTIVRALMVDQDALIARAADYAKALKAGAACGVA